MRFFIYSIILLVFAACSDSASETSPNADGNGSTKQITNIQWLDSVRNFGKINEGQKLSVSFRFRNTGDKPLVIESVKPACGCTVADYPKQPIQPGEEGEITGAFDSGGRPGQQHKEITVVSNTPAGSHNVIFEVDVLGRKGQPNMN